MKNIIVNEESKSFKKGDRVLMPAIVIATSEQNGQKRVNIRTRDLAVYGIYGKNAIANLLLVEGRPESPAEAKETAKNAKEHVEEFAQVVEDRERESVRDHNVGRSDYASHKIQPWDIWEEYQLNPWDADIVKRILRVKMEPGMTVEESRAMDYEKIIHVCQERLRQLKK